MSTDAPPNKPRLVQVVFDGANSRASLRRTTLALQVLLLIFVGTTITWISTSAIVGAIATLGAIVVSATVCLLWILVSLYRHRSAVLAAIPRDSNCGIPCARELHHELAYGDFRLSIESATAALFRAGCEGHAYVIHARSDSTDFEPLIEMIEPVPLNEADARFRSVAAITGAESPADVDPLLVWARSFQRIGGVGGMTVAILVLPHVTVLLHQFSFAAASAIYRIPLMIVLAIGAFVLLLKWVIAGRSTHWLVPGGVVCQSGHWWAKSNHVSIARATDAVLVLLPLHDGTWRFHTKQFGANFGGAITRAEAAMLVRFWSSPVEGPSDAAIHEVLR